MTFTILNDKKLAADLMNTPEYHLFAKPGISYKTLKVAVLCAFLFPSLIIVITCIYWKKYVQKNEILIVNVGKATVSGTNIIFTLGKNYKTLPPNAVSAYKLSGTEDEKILVFATTNEKHIEYVLGITKNTNVQSRIINQPSVGTRLIMMRIRDPQIKKQ